MDRAFQTQFYTEDILQTVTARKEMSSPGYQLT